MMRFQRNVVFGKSGLTVCRALESCTILVLFSAMLFTGCGGITMTPSIEVISDTSEELVLQCESTGWDSEPEVLWRDSEGNLLSVGPTETVRGSDDLYTVKSRVTVGKKHSNRFTCRVQQNHITQSRETHFYVKAFDVQDSHCPHWVMWFASVVVAVCIVVLIVVWIRQCNALRRHRMD